MRRIIPLFLISLIAAAPATMPTQTTQPVTSVLISAAKEKFQAGDLIAARASLNSALGSESLSAADQIAAREMLRQIGEKVTLSPLRFNDDPLATSYVVQKGDTLGKIAAANGLTPAFLARINRISDPRKVFLGAKLKVIKGPFYAVVTKQSFMMDIYLGDPNQVGSVLVTSFPVGLGKDDSTPTGRWICDGHQRHPTYYSPRGEGVFEYGDPRNPLGGYWIALKGLNGQAAGKLSYGIHGTNDENSVGTQSSMGCIRLKQADIAAVFDLLVDGKSDVIVREALPGALTSGQ